MVEKGELKPDGKILMKTGQAHVVKAAVEPVWYLPGVAERFKVSERDLRMQLFLQTNGMYPELVTRNDMKVFLPPIGGLTVYIFGDHTTLSDPEKVRIHLLPPSAHPVTKLLLRRNLPFVSMMSAMAVTFLALISVLAALTSSMALRSASAPRNAAVLV